MSARKSRYPAHTFRLRPLVWSLLVACGGLPYGVQAAKTDISDTPLAVLKTIQPNVYITLDKSGSMQAIMGQTNRYYTFGYNNTVRYRPWLLDGITPPPRGPVRFEEVDMDIAPGVCSGIDFGSYLATPGTPSAGQADVIKPNADSSLVWANGYMPGAGSNPDYVRAECSVRGLRTTAGTGTTALRENSVGYYDSGTTSNARARIDNLIASRPTGTPPAGRTDCSPSGCTAEQERKNISNYWQYHRNRYLAARAAIGEAIGRQKDTARVGFANFSTANSGTSSNAATGRAIKNYLDRYRIVTIKTRDGSGNIGADSPRYKFFAEQLYNQTPAYNGTPTRWALYQLGQYFMTDEPYRDDPANAASPIRTCRGNYNILVTDGGWNDTFTTVANADGSAGAPYQDSYSSTLADVAYYYYATDLRSTYANNVPTSIKDPADWQHLVNYAVSMNMPLTGESAPNATNVNSAKVNAIFDWMSLDPDSRGAAPTITWPDANSTSSDEKRVDDLAHAGINSHGGFINASNPQQLTRAILAALNDAAGRSTSAAITVNNNPDQPLKDGDIAYLTGYDAASWSGQVRAVHINPITGGPDFDSPVWTPSADKQLGNPGANNNRRIVTWKGRLGSGGIPFKAGQELADGSTNLEDKFHLNAAGNDGAKVIEYLRGDRSNEGLDDANYRERDRGKGTLSDPGTVLGDIVESGAILNVSGTEYVDPGHEEFRTGQVTKDKTVFVGANDGMVHAFDAATGAESWAYIPSFSWDCLLASNESACPKQSGGTRPSNLLRDSVMPFGFQHRFFVNGPLLVTDVDFSNGSGTDWRTILTGSLGKGGRGVFALDVTDPQASDDDQAMGKVLWEFPARLSDGTVPEYTKNMGYVSDQIHMGKVKIGSNTKWVAYVPSGFNNGSETGGDGKARLFVLDAKTGALIKEIVAGASDTNAGSPETPASMAYIAVHMKDQATDHAGSVVYGADQLGNTWRFDLTSNNTAHWEAKKAAVLKADSGQLSGPQPVTTPPVISEGTDQNNNKRIYIMIGTGRYLDTVDRPGNPDNSADQNKTAKQTQTFYVFKDPFQKDDSGNYLEGGATLTNLRSVLSKYTISTPGNVGASRVFQLAATPPDDYQGFYFDLTASDPIYERVNVPFKATGVAVVLATNAPSTDPCDQRGKGSSLTVPLVDIPDAGIVGMLGNRSPSVQIKAGESLGSLVITAVAVFKNKEGKIVAAYSVDTPVSAADCAALKAKGYGCKAGEPYVWKELESAVAPPPRLPTKRVYWRDMSIE